MMNFMMMMIEWTLLFTTSINSSSSSLSASYSIEHTSSRTQQQPTPFQTYFPIDASMNNCQWKHHLVYTKSFNELVDSRVSEFLKSPIAAPSCQRSIEPSIKCSWWEWNLRCTEELVVFPISDRISSFVTLLGKQWKALEGLDYYFHEHFYGIDDDYYSGAEMLHSYLSFEMYEELISASETTVTADYNNTWELASLPKTIKVWLDIASVKISAYAKLQLLDLHRTGLRYIISTQEKQQATSTSFAHTSETIKAPPVELLTKAISARYSQVQHLLQAGLDGILAANQTELILVEDQCAPDEALLWKTRRLAVTAGWFLRFFETGVKHIIATAGRQLSVLDGYQCETDRFMKNITRTLWESTSSAHVGQDHWLPTRGVLNESAMNQTKLILVDESECETMETILFLWENRLGPFSAPVWEGRWISPSVNGTAAAMDQQSLILSGKNQSATDELLASSSKETGSNSTASTRLDGDVWVLVWELEAIILAILCIVFAGPGRNGSTIARKGRNRYRQ